MSDVENAAPAGVPQSQSARRARASRVESIDGLRGVLAASVAIAHFANAYGHPALIPLAKCAVMLFFVISGYVLTRAWNGNFGSFLVKRYVRLWPVYAASLAAGAYFSGSHPAWTVYFWFPYLGIGDTVAADPVVWSLFVAAWATLLMPIVIWIGRRDIPTLIAIFALLVVKGASEGLYFGLFFLFGSYFSRCRFDVAWLNSKPLRWLGKISYSLYLSHVIVIGVCKIGLPALAPFIALPLCLIVAQFLWFTIERPSLWASKTLGRWIESQTAGRLPPLLARANAGARFDPSQ
jgi:peptidoglycan/LPS O-acetylase OafA/YrhL